MTEQQTPPPTRKHGGDSHVHRRQRGKNLAVLAALFAFVAIIYVVAMIRMSGGTFP
ncbi:hypothetical protein [Niveispirillum sp.]|uniref:hypothetical protein n=1 Tax=Niveispirillum sp. TaxID=1917217 RepID=UPI001B66C08F|nr:hypothetical protein [Niveispirillum sp.]MBP7336818.1 hypothetical protein [Niveispirillum sp.]